MNLRIIVILTAISVALFDCGENMPTEPSEQKTAFEVNYYDLFFVVDAQNKLFQSTQEITITSVYGTDRLVFDIYSTLQIDDLQLTATDGTEISTSGWELIGDVPYERSWGQEIFSRVKVQTAQHVPSGQKLKLKIDYHMQPAAIRNSAGSELLALMISTRGSRAIAPVSGILPVFGGNIVAPFRLVIKYPQDQHSCVPGNLITTNSEGQFSIDSYESEVPLIPVFYVAPCEKQVRSRDGLNVEYYLPPGQSFAEKMLDNTFDTVELYSRYFGDPGTDTYRFAFIDVDRSAITGENKGNAIYLLSGRFSDYDQNVETQMQFAWLINHELFHNWNLWNIRWTGKLYEWFSEGGASFIAAWANEVIYGEEAGAASRSSYVKSFIQNKGYESAKSLEYAQKTSAAERSLIYSYGPLVWEQLRQKIGDEALFSGLTNFFAQYTLQPASYVELLACIQSQTQVDVGAYIDQWIKNRGRINFSIKNVFIRENAGLYETEVTLNIDSKNDYEIFTAVGYKTSVNGDMKKVAVHTTRNGTATVSFESELQPLFIQIDPDSRVPQINLHDDQWEL